MIFISKSFRAIVFILIFFPQRFGCCILRASSGDPVYLGIEMIQPGKSFLMFDCWSTVKLLKCPDKQGTPEEGRRIQRPKRCGKNNKDKDNSPKTLTDKNHQA